MNRMKQNWTTQEIRDIYNIPLLNLVYKAATIYRENFDPQKIQLCTLLSVKTGNCPEDCSYCSQSSHYQTFVETEKLKSIDEVKNAAMTAKKNGATRFCMGAAWRNMTRNHNFDKILEMIREVSSLGLQVCCSMGMLSEEQAMELKKAGLYAYNHNLDTSPEYYKKIVTTRTYEDRLQTLRKIHGAELSVCCGCILGLGESIEDRIQFIEQLTKLDAPPDSIPINVLVPIKNTPLGDNPKVSAWELVRMIATVRIIMPKSVIRLSAGRLFFSEIEQALFFMAGANSFFIGDKLLTTPNNKELEDISMLKNLGLVGHTF